MGEVFSTARQTPHNVGLGLATQVVQGPARRSLVQTELARYEPKIMESRAQKLESLGYPLDRIPKPGAIYRPVVVSGTTAYVSGCVPFDGDGNLVSVGKVGRDLTLEEAQKVAALCAANVLRLLRAELGSLDRIVRMIRVGGYVNCTEDFTDQHLVINGASELFAQVLGDAGPHARTALGLQQLPLGSSVEVDAICEVTPA